MSRSMPDGIKTTLGWTIGIASVALILLVFIVIFGNLSDNIGLGTSSTIFVNNTINLSSAGAIPTEADNRVDATLSNVVIKNDTNTIASGNYTITGVTITVSENIAAEMNGSFYNVSGTVTYDSAINVEAEGIITNYSSSAVNTSKQLPTAGTILGVVILLAILIGLLVYVIVKVMGISGKVGAGSSGSSGFEGSSRSYS